MKLQLFLLSALCITGISAKAQTKKIAFESHSGSPENFAATIGHDLFDKGESGFGLPANKTAYKLDSVIFISDTVSVLVSKEYKRPWSATSDSLDKLVGEKKDTVYNDPLFSRQYIVDSIKKMMDRRGLYETTNKTKFVGFDNKKGGIKKSGEKQQQLTPFFITNDPPDDHNPIDTRLILMLGFLLLLSLLGGWLSWRLYQPRFQL
jgi:hypothetical protein